MIRCQSFPSLWLLLLLPLGADGQTLSSTNATAATNTVSLLSETNLATVAIQSFITQFQSNGEITEEVKKAALEPYQSALKLAGDRDAFARLAAEHALTIAGTSNRVQALKSDLAVEVSRGTNVVDAALGSKATEALINEVEADLHPAREKLAVLQAEPKRRATRREEIPVAISVAKAKLEEIANALKTAAPTGQPPEISQAIRLHLLTRRSYRLQEIAALESEVRVYDATGELLSLETDRQALRVAQLARYLDALRHHFTTAKDRESKQAVKQAQAELDSQLMRVYPALADLAQTNVHLANLRIRLAEQLDRAHRDLSAAEKNLANLELAFRNVVDRVRANESAGVRISDSVGLLLRKHRDELTRTTTLRNRIRTRLSNINDIQLAELERSAEKDVLLDIEGAVEAQVRAIEAQRKALPDDERATVADKTRSLLKSRRDLLTELVNSYRSLNANLIKLNRVEVDLEKKTTAFAKYVEERVLWVRSAEAITFRDALDEMAAIGGLLHPANWKLAGGALLLALAESPFTNGFWLLAVIAIFCLQRRARRALRELADLAKTREQVSLAPTLRSWLPTLILAVPGPLLMIVLSWMLKEGNPANAFVLGLAEALPVGGLVYFTLGLYRHVARIHGLGGGHFGWTEENIRLIRRHLNWFMPPAIALVAIVAFVESQDGVDARWSLVAFAALTISLGYLLLHPVHGITYTTASGRVHDGHRRIRFVIALLAPLVIAIVSIRGYHFTAIEFGWRLMNSLWLVVGVTLLSAVIVRWFYLERKRIALDKLQKKREAAAADPEAAKAIAAEIPDVNLTEVKEQTQSLLRTVVLATVVSGMWLLWSDVLPALNVFEKKTLWHIEASAAPVAKTDESAIPGLDLDPEKFTEGADKDSDQTKPAKTVLRPVTLADVLLAGIILLLTLIAGRNLPGFLEISLLKHLHLEPGGGYAVTTLVRYAVALIGIVAAFAAIGITWQKVQWLAAAVTLGIGFGLQEIFANFVAGIILLFERPVRVGDVITVDNTTGTVSKIRIRATTIVNWERQELIVPNKQLVTGKLTNWTLSDKINRVVITVGIAYGSDTRLAREILKDILANNPYVMKDPRPRVTFDLFGESSLNFTIRTFIGTMDDRLNAIHSLHTEIDDRFRANNITIAFPQRDLHLHTVPEAWGPAAPPAPTPT